MIFKEDITYNDIISILSRNPKANVNFRYYQKRNESCLNNHLYHFILYDIFPVGYGHLDLEDNKLWLGMCIFDDYVGLGYGKLVLDNLIKNRKQAELYLSVDKENYRAINLYLNNGFKIYDQTEHIYFCNLK